MVIFFVCLVLVSCPSATFALQHGGFVPREWLAAKSLSIKFTGYIVFAGRGHQKIIEVMIS